MRRSYIARKRKQCWNSRSINMADTAVAGERWTPVAGLATFMFFVPLVMNLTTVAAVMTKRVRLSFISRATKINCVAKCIHDCAGTVHAKKDKKHQILLIFLKSGIMNGKSARRYFLRLSAVCYMISDRVCAREQHFTLKIRWSFCQNPDPPGSNQESGEGWQ